MNNWFTVTVKYTKALDNGTFKRVSEPYLVASMTFTDAEARIYEELGSIIRGEFVVKNVGRTDFHDIFQYDDADTWYKCKITYQSQNLDDEKQKKITQTFLIGARNVKEAYERMQESLSTLMVDFEIPLIQVSPIVDIFPYNENLDKEISRTPISSEEDSESFEASEEDESEYELHQDNDISDED